MTSRRVAVVGGGLAGLACARTLAERGQTVVVFDKGRAPGGRACSRVRDGRTFDHGAQYFTARSEWLLREVESWARAGVVAPWSPRGKPDAETWWVGTPTMGALAQHLARDLDVRLERRVTSIEGGVIADASGVLAEVDAVVVALPAAQAAALVGDVGSAELDPCWAVMVVLGPASAGLPRPGWRPALDVLQDGAPIAWAARESSKPGRPFVPHDDAWTLHLSTSWSREHLEDAPEAVAAAMSALFQKQHAPQAAVLESRAHRWRYARARKSTSAPCRFDPARRLLVCGDWLSSPRIEGALTSGVAAAEMLLAAR